MLYEDDIISRIEELCQRKNMSRYRLSQKSGLSQSTISNLLNRKSLPNLITLENICRGFGITLSQFFLKDGSEVDLSEEQKKILDEWSTLSDTERKLVSAYIQGMRHK